MKHDYLSLGHVHEINTKIEHNKKSLADMYSQIEKDTVKCNELEQKLISEDPAIAKKIEKAKGNPKSIDDKTYNWYAWENPLHTICWDFGRLYKKIHFELPREIEKLNVKNTELKTEKERIEAKLGTHYNLRDNLPEQFKEALSIVKQQIHDCFEKDQKNNISGLEECLKFPLFYSLIQDKYLLKHIENKSGKKLAKLSDEQLIEQYGEIYISGYSFPTVKKTLEDHRDHFVKTTKAKIAMENARNIDRETEMYYIEVECQFVDQIAVYCSDILSVENVELGRDGSINGIIHSTNGDWYIKTIGAGGYNIQKFHYRVIMRKIN